MMIWCALVVGLFLLIAMGQVIKGKSEDRVRRKWLQEKAAHPERHTSPVHREVRQRF